MKGVELVGILNITPDSFSDGGEYFRPHDALIRANELFEEGASYLDVGAESTRPGATPLEPDEEWRRLAPVLSDLVFSHPDHISIDTYHPETVRRACREIGSFIINDVTGFNNPKMVAAAAELGLPCIVSHLPKQRGQDIQAAHTAIRKVSSQEQVVDELLARREQLIDAGVDSGKIILDPGIGFGKTEALNWQLLEFASLVPGIDVMVGYSRKKFLGEDRMELAPNIAAGRVAIQAGTRYLRVHDVAGHKRDLAG